MQIDRLPGEMRDRLRAALPQRAFLRRDRGNALFITNAPAFEGCPDAIPGFLLERQGNMLRILPDDSWIALPEHAGDAPPDFLCASLLRFRGALPDRANLALFARGLKLLDDIHAASEADIAAFDRLLRQQAALALRGNCGGGLYACALTLAQIHTLYKGEKRP